jgi:quercetin dioxygenase-like cupin family protein
MPVLTLDSLDRSEEIPGFLGAFRHTENMTVVHWSVEAGAEFPEHAHPHEQISVVTKGEFELTLDGEPQILRDGRVAIIPARTAHAGRAITECDIIDVFSPVREDYRRDE